VVGCAHLSGTAGGAGKSITCNSQLHAAMPLIIAIDYYGAANSLLSTAHIIFEYYTSTLVLQICLTNAIARAVTKKEIKNFEHKKCKNSPIIG